MNEPLEQRFLTGGPWRGSRGSAKITKVKRYPLKPILQGFWGPPVVLIDTLGVHEIFFLTFRGPRSIKG